MKKDKKNDFIEVFAGSSIDAEIVKSLLIDSEIVAFLRNENMGTIAPWHASPGGVGSVKIVVSNLDYDKAKLVVEEYFNNINSK